MKAAKHTQFLLLLLFAFFLQAQDRDTLLIDFGDDPAPAPWNNVSDPLAGAIPDLTNALGNPSGYGIVVTDAFNNINRAGTQEPNPSLGLPPAATGDSFFGSVTDFGGRTEPTGAITLTNLRPEKEYTISIFASRAATDNREASYATTGATTDTLYLDAADNTDSIVTITLFPAADSTIVVTAAPGPNNNNSAKFYYFGALTVSYAAEEPPAPMADNGGDTLLIDFGSVLSPAPWNNVDTPANGRIDNLMNDEGLLTGISLMVVDSFNSINTAGTQVPNPSLRLPGSASGDSFFGNVTPFGGQVQPTGAIELGGLDPNVAYEFQIFASRSATDNREATYMLVGQTTNVVFLDAASNVDSIAVTTLFPAADSTIRLMASPGPNNTNSAGFYYLGALRVGYTPPVVEVPLDTVLVDFGGTSTTPRPWNNVTDAAAGTVADLINSSGFQTGYGLSIYDDFNGVNTAGTINPNPDLEIPATASGDSFFGNVTEFAGQLQPTAGVELTELTLDKSYTVELFASRTAGDNRETQYVVMGQTVDTVYLDAASNSDSIATATVLPDSSGTIRIAVSPGPNNTNSASFYYLGAMRLLYGNEAPAGGPSLALLNPNGGEFWQVGKTPSITWEAQNLDDVILEYSTDGGTSFTTIDTVGAFLEEYAWTVPDTPTENAVVRITSDSLTDVSDAPFVISTDTTTCTVVVLGSSTAAGTGASSPDSAWVNRYAASLADDTRYEVINLGRGGYTTYHIVPTGSEVPTGVTIFPDQLRNVTRALSFDPFAIIVNMPSNDAANNFTVAAQLANFAAIAEAGSANGAQVYIATTQPRNFTNTAQVNIQQAVRDSIFSIYGERAIDFWNGLAAENGFVLDSVDSGDGVHVNDVGHRLLFERVNDLMLDTLDCNPMSTSTRPVPVPLTGVTVYPNPTPDGTFYVELAAEIRGRVDIRLVDMLGRERFTKLDALPIGGSHRIALRTGITPASGSEYLFCIVTVTDKGTVRQKVLPVLVK